MLHVNAKHHQFDTNLENKRFDAQNKKLQYRSRTVLPSQPQTHTLRYSQGTKSARCGKKPPIHPGPWGRFCYRRVGHWYSNSSRRIQTFDFLLTKLLSLEATNNATGVDFSDLIGRLLEFSVNLKAFLSKPRWQPYMYRGATIYLKNILTEKLVCIRARCDGVRTWFFNRIKDVKHGL